MGLYDQFLQLNQQGLDTGNQIALQRAQQPTMADVFMNRFRQGGQDMLARQKAEAEQAYHTQLAQNAQMDKQGKALSVAFQHGNPSNIGAIIPFLQQAGVDTSGFTPETFKGSKQYASDQTLAGTQDTNNTKWNIALLKDDTDRWADSIKLMKPQDALGKLNWDYQNGLIDGYQYSDRYAKINTIVNPLAGPMATQGLYTSPTLPPKAVPLPFGGQQRLGQPPIPIAPQPLAVGPTAPPVQPQGQDPAAPGALVISEQPQAVPPTKPQLPVASVSTSGGSKNFATPTTQLTPKGAQEASKLQAEKDANIQKLDGLSRDIDEAIEHPGFSKVVGKYGVLYRNPASDEGYPAYQILSKIKESGTLGALLELKKMGGTLGQVSNQEGERLEKSFAAIDLNQPEAELVKQLRRVQGDIETSRKRIYSAAQQAAGGLGVSVGDYHPIGEVQTDSAGNKWEYRGGNYTDRSRWKMVGGK